MGQRVFWKEKWWITHQLLKIKLGFWIQFTFLQFRSHEYKKRRVRKMCICKKDKNWVKSRRQIGTIKKKPFYGNKVCKIQPKYFLVTLKNCHRKNSQNQRKRPVLNLQKHYRIYCWIQSGISLRKPTIIFLPKKAKGVGRRHFVRCKVWELLYSICNLYIRKSGSCSSGLFCSGTWKPTKKRSFVIRSIRSTKLLQQCCQMCPQRDDDIYQKRENRTNSESFWYWLHY